MSVRVMALVWDSTVPAPERFTLLALADRADEDGRCWPSIATLAAKCRTRDRTIQRHLSSLREIGVLSIHQRFNNSSSYVINVARLRAMAAADDVVEERAGGEPAVARRPRSTPRQSVTPRQIVTPVNLSPGDKNDRLGCQIDTLSISDPSIPTADAVGKSARERARANANPAVTRRQASKESAGTRLPDEFRVTREMAQWAAEKVPDLDWRRHTEAFVDYWRDQPGAKGRKVSWHGTWRNWMRKAAADEARAHRPRPAHRSTTDDRIAALQAMKNRPAQQLAIGGS